MDGKEEKLATINYKSIATPAVKGFWQGVGIHELMNAYSSKREVYHPGGLHDYHLAELRSGLSLLATTDALLSNREVPMHLENIVAIHINDREFLQRYEQLVSELGLQSLKQNEKRSGQGSLKFSGFFDVS